MCGLLGYYSKRGILDSTVENALDLLAHRGPDSRGTYYSLNRNLFLGHHRLSIIDLSDAGNQPFYSTDRRYVIVYNGEIYNFRELTNKHALKLRTQCDTEVIIELFIKLGPAFISELNGMFSIAIYDTIEEEIFIYRDRIGIKPLYYSITSDGLVFASELNPVLSCIGKRNISQSAVQQLLHRGYIPEPLTLYDDVFKFPAGAMGKFEKGEFSINHYWRAEDYIKSNVESDEKKVIGTVHELLRESVKYRMIADVEFGTFLSGGSDSGLISAIAAELSDKTISTFNVSFEDALFDETPYAKEMARIIGSKHYNIKVTRQEVLNTLEIGMKLIGEPFADSSIFPTMAVSNYARNHVKMILSGDGGDELFMGYGAYNWATRLSNPIIWHSRYAIATALRFSNTNRNNRAGNVFAASDLKSISSHIFSQEQNFFSADEIEKLTNSKFSDLYSDEFLKKLPRKLTSAEKQAFFDLTNYLKDDLLVKVDRSSMRFGLEVRVPFLDHRLVEYSLNIDPKLKNKEGESKYIIKKIMESYFPKNLIYRQKNGFSVPLEKWMKGTDYFSQPISLPPNMKNTYEKILHTYSNSKNHAYLYNRLYTLRCLDNYLIEH